MSYTQFGEYFRILRIKNREVLADAKEFLNASSAFISAVECGKKQIPEDWFIKIVTHYNLDEVEQVNLKEAIELSKTSIKICLTTASPIQRSVAVQFQRSFDDLDEVEMIEIQKILERNIRK